MPGGVCGAVSGMPAGNGLGSSSFSRRAVHDCGLRGAASPHESDWTPSCAARLPNSGRQETRYAARATAARWQKVPETQMARRSGAVVKSSTDGWAAAVNESGEEHQELKTRARAQCEDRTQRPGSLWAWGGGGSWSPVTWALGCLCCLCQSSAQPWKTPGKHSTQRSAIRVEYLRASGNLVPDASPFPNCVAGSSGHRAISPWDLVKLWSRPSQDQPGSPSFSGVHLPQSPF